MTIKLKDYKQLTLNHLRQKDTILKLISDNQLIDLYRDYVWLFFSTKWLDVRQLDFEHFYDWVVKSPLQRELDKRES